MLLTMFVCLLAVSLIAAFLAISLQTWSLGIAAVIVLFAISGGLGDLGFWLLAIIFGGAAIFLNNTAMRQQWLSAPFLKIYRKMTPSLSKTEKIALDAGTVGWEGDLFTGNPDWNKLLDSKTPKLTPEEQAFLDGPVEGFCDLIDEWDLTHIEADLRPEGWKFIKDHRFLGMIIPKEYGGLGFSALAHRAVIEKISTVSGVANTLVSVPNSLGPAELILKYGTEEQKNYFLPRLAKGDEIPCFGLTGPEAGSDATSIPDSGVVCKGKWKGKTVVGLRMNFDKRYITMAPDATLVGIAFQMYDPDGLLGDKKELGITLNMIPSDLKGLDIGRRHFPLNVPFSNGPIRGKDLFVPLDTIIGGAEMAGHGWAMLVECLSVGRAISLPSGATGSAKTAALTSGAYTRIRTQFNMPIGKFEGVQEALARIGGNTYTVSALSKATAVAVDHGEKPSVPSAIAKYHTTELTRQIIQDAMDVHGGKGIILGPKNYLGRMWQGAPVGITVEGANILTRSMIIFGQGAIRCHPYVLKEMEAAVIEDHEQRLDTFDKLLFGHIGFTISNAVRALILGLSGSRLAKAPAGSATTRYYQQLSRYSAAFAFLADTTLLSLGAELKRKERLSARLGDLLSHLYIGSAILKRFEDEGRPAADLPLLQWSMQDTLYRLQEAMRGIVDNFPNAAVGFALKLLVMPLGARQKLPSDKLGTKVAELLMTPSESRDRLCRGLYTSDRAGHPIGKMETALPIIIAAAPVEKKFIKAIRSAAIEGLTWEERLQSAMLQNLITQDEAVILKQARALRLEVIAVDDFDHSEIKAARALPAEKANAA
ncbi:MAG: acyl-CoA dehydrogenase [Xanthomonadales bacterium]|nr:acyl-CoA dehydrogenase [Xanthomonadales bacterium]